MTYTPRTVLAPGAPWPRAGASDAEMRQDWVDRMLRIRPMTLPDLMAATGFSRDAMFRLTENAERAKSTGQDMYYWLPETPYDKDVYATEYQVMWWLKTHKWCEARKMPESIGTNDRINAYLRRAEADGKVERRLVKGRKANYEWRWVK